MLHGAGVSGTGASKAPGRADISQVRALSAAAVAWLAGGLLLACVCLPAQAVAASAGHASHAPAPSRTPAPVTRTVKLLASFSPERLGAGTTISFGLRIATAPGHAPSPVTDIELLLPSGLGIASSDLGLETCTPAELERDGLAGCPPDSLMGRGSAAAEVPFGAAFVTEQAPVELFSGPLQDGHPQLLFFASGEYPVLASFIFGALVLPAKAPFGGVLNTTLPLVPGVPEGPDVALVRLQTTIGAQPHHLLRTRRAARRSAFSRAASCCRAAARAEGSRSPRT